jgi:hypothetical protein
MWVCTSWGVLMPGLRPDGTIPEGDDKVLQVRARRKKDLVMLKDKFMGEELGEIFSMPHTDYEWRAYCTLEAWGKALAQIGMDIDYVKFKETAEKKYNDHELHSLYLSMWSTIFSHLSLQSHQDDYWSWSGAGIHGTVGKYGTTYGGTGSFSTGRKGKKVKGKNRSAGNRSYYTPDAKGYYTPDQDPATFLRRNPWWSDNEDPYINDDDDLGLGGYTEFLEKTLSGDDSADSFASLFEAFEDLDPAEKPVFKSDNSNEIDHVYCDHGISKSAKKRCRARWRRYARTRVQRQFGSVR